MRDEHVHVPGHFISRIGLCVYYIYYCCRFMYPQHMLSQHFLTEGKKAEFVAAAAEVRGQNLRKLLGDQLQDNSEQWRQLKACLNAVRVHTQCYIVACEDKKKICYVQLNLRNDHPKLALL